MARTRHKLIRMRREALLNQEDAAYRSGLSRTSIVRYETGQQTPGVNACRALARTYERTVEEVLDAIDSNGELPALADGWWSNYEAMEQSAVAIRTWEPMVIPGLLQIEGYARALLENDELVERRMERQVVITRNHEPPKLVAIVDESVLHRPVGGPGVLAEQLQHLLTMAKRPNVTVRVLPLDAPEEAIAIGGKGAFVILEPSWPGGMVHQEYEGGSHILHSKHDLATLLAAFDCLCKLALSQTDSLALIRNRVRNWSHDQRLEVEEGEFQHQPG